MTPYYALTGDQLLTLSNTGTKPATVVFYQADGTVVGDVVIPAGVSGDTYLPKKSASGRDGSVSGGGYCERGMVGVRETFLKKIFFHFIFLI